MIQFRCTCLCKEMEGAFLQMTLHMAILIKELILWME